VIESPLDSVEVADTVAVRVEERPWVHLIDDGVVPPGDVSVIHHCGGDSP
jgi:hypothetical protein